MDKNPYVNQKFLVVALNELYMNYMWIESECCVWYNDIWYVKGM